MNKALRNLDEHAALRAILEGTATQTGERFFQALVKSLGQALETHGAWVTEYLPECRQLRSLAFWLDGEFVDQYDYDVEGTPCEGVVERAELIHHPDNIIELYPGDNDLTKLKAVSFMGAPLVDLDGVVLGHLAVLDTRPLPHEPRLMELFQVFGARAAAELQRMRAEQDLRDREEKLTGLFDGALDAIIELDDALNVTNANPASLKAFSCSRGQMLSQPFLPFLDNNSAQKLTHLINQLDAQPQDQQYLWIPAGLTGVAATGQTFPAEATLSRYRVGRHVYHTLILRNVNGRLEAEQKIHTLSEQAAYLRRELDDLQNFGTIIGQSDAIRRVLAEVEQVAPTDATVLIQGETGTGKELIARAVHESSPRRNQPLIKVNCAAIPANLIESEFFGHEKGAFTGATTKRDGRFALADGGTIFLDEVGELPLDLQAKLLRVLQEGEFEPVGSARTQKVDVRVIAATNRDLQQDAAQATFREDLYYRLSVFPLRLPPLRERAEDIAILARAFVQQFAKRMARPAPDLTEQAVSRLRAYHWPGNVRELQNVIERALITGQGTLDLQRSLPDATAHSTTTNNNTSTDTPPPVMTVEQLERLERDNIIRALHASQWRVSGPQGAALMLGMKPSTLSSRIKALGIVRD